MNENALMKAIERQDWLDSAADRLQNAVSTAYASAGEPGAKVKDFLHGTWLGHPLHSAITDLPVGAWTSAAAMDAMEDITGDEFFGRAADAAISVGIAGAIAAAAAGVTDWHVTDGRARKIGLAHGLLNVAGLLLYSTALANRRNGSRRLGKGLSIMGFLTTMTAAYIGGHLTYREQIGADHSLGQRYPNEFTPVLPESELKEGEMKRADAGGGRVLLARHGGRIFAISEVCPHLGGPLAEGTFEDGVVTCPWHGSRLSLEDGRIVSGPTTHPAPCLDVRTRDGQIEIRAMQPGTSQ
jgi:nitrite reductase/ring-hydroxylating ferredoxin subunit/uncharacterized membrane protein